MTTFDAVLDLSCYNREQAESAWESLGARSRRWLHLSSAAVYAVVSTRPHHEDDPVGGGAAWGTYGRNKAAADGFVAGLDTQTPRLCLRVPYLYGLADPDARETYMWSRILQGRPILIPGRGDARIEVLHVEDLADALLRCLLTPLGDTGVFNISASEAYTLSDWVRCMAGVCGVIHKEVLMGTSSTDFPDTQYFPFPNVQCQLDGTRFQRSYAWSPAFTLFSGLSEMFRAIDATALRKLSLITDLEDFLLRRRRLAGTLSIVHGVVSEARR